MPILSLLLSLKTKIWPICKVSLSKLLSPFNSETESPNWLAILYKVSPFFTVYVFGVVSVPPEVPGG